MCVFVYSTLCLLLVDLSFSSSTLMISTAAKGKVASLVAVNTTLGAAAGALSGMFTSTILDERKTGVYQWDTTAASELFAFDHDVPKTMRTRHPQRTPFL